MMGSSSAESASVFTLLDVIADPDKYKAKLTEMATQAADLAQLQESYNSVRDGVEKARAEAEQYNAEAKAKLLEATTIQDQVSTELQQKLQDASNLKTQLDTREADLAAKERDFATELMLKTSVLDQREATVTKREADVSSLQTTTADLNATANALVQEYTDKLAQLKNIIG